MSLDLTPVARAEMYVARLEFDADTTLKFIQNDPDVGWKVLHTLTQTDDWSIRGLENLYINVDFLRLEMLEFDGLEDILAKTEGFYFEGIKYQIVRMHRPIGLTRVWGFKLEPIDDYPSNTIPIE